MTETAEDIVKDYALHGQVKGDYDIIKVVDPFMTGPEYPSPTEYELEDKGLYIELPKQEIIADIRECIAEGEDYYGKCCSEADIEELDTLGTIEAVFRGEYPMECVYLDEVRIVWK